MSHLDEGTLHALLDGELELHEVREIQAHLGSCTACDTRLQAAKDVFGEADRLVAAVQFPGRLKAPPGAATEPEEEEPLPPATVPPPQRRERRIDARPVVETDTPQMVILPEENSWPERRRRLMVMGRWAALLVVAVGAGYVASEAGKDSSRAALEFDRPASAVVSPEETAGPDTAGPDTTTVLQKLAAGAAAAESTDAMEPTPPPRQAREAPRDAAPAPERRAPAATPTPTPDEASQVEETTVTATPQNEEPQAETTAFEAATQEDIREEAAEALAELDRQRRRDRAAAATAAIDRARRDAPRPAATAAPSETEQSAPAPTPRTLEQRSGIYLRIGLDEAARQLGRPVHVIEGLNSQFMGLVQGRQSPGADGGRPVVRVVYQDSQGRMILLDQQRIRPEQNWPSGATRWTVGEIGLLLHGDAPTEVLRNLRPRVR